MVTVEDLRRIFPKWGDAEMFCEHLNSAMVEFDISTPLREAAFIAQFVHERGDRHANGHGDGYGKRGFIAGREQYGLCGEGIGVDLLTRPELLDEPETACRACAWWWQDNGFNEMADEENFQLITKRIAGGYPQYRERVAVYERAKAVMT